MSSSSSSSSSHVYQGYLSSASSGAGGEEPIDWPYYLPSTHELAAAAAMGAGAGVGAGEEEAAAWALKFAVPAVSGRRGRRPDHGRGMDPMAVRLLGKLGADGKDYNYELERCNNGVPGGSSSFSMMQQQEELVGEEANPHPPDPVRVQRPVVEMGFDLNLRPAPEAVGFEFDLNEPAPEAVAAAAADQEEEEEEEEENDPAPAAN